jgi:hypothetical protein
MNMFIPMLWRMVEYVGMCALYKEVILQQVWGVTVGN